MGRNGGRSTHERGMLGRSGRGDSLSIHRGGEKEGRSGPVRSDTKRGDETMCTVLCNMGRECEVVAVNNSPIFTSRDTCTSIEHGLSHRVDSTWG